MTACARGFQAAHRYPLVRFRSFFAEEFPPRNRPCRTKVHPSRNRRTELASSHRHSKSDRGVAGLEYLRDGIRALLEADRYDVTAARGMRDATNAELSRPLDLILVTFDLAANEMASVARGIRANSGLRFNQTNFGILHSCATERRRDATG